jgi:hypothetical protein
MQGIADCQPRQNRDKQAREIDRQRSASAMQNVELTAKGEHLHLKSGASPKAIPHCCQNGH